MSELIHIAIDKILTNWKWTCLYKDPECEIIEECSVGRIAEWGAHYICIIHDDVPEDEREKVAKFISEAPEAIKDLQKKSKE